MFGILASAQDNGPYKVLKIQLTGGDGGFDYVTADPDGRNLYVARSGPAGHIGVYNLLRRGVALFGEFCQNLVADFFLEFRQIHVVFGAFFDKLKIKAC